MSGYKVTYFDARGLAESIRLILTVAGVEFEDRRIVLDFTPGAKPISDELRETLPWGQIPVLEWGDGNILAQSLTICRFLANKFGLAGSSEYHSAKCEEIVDGMRDFQNDYFRPWFVAFGDKNREEKQVEIKKTLMEKGLPNCFARLEKLVEKHGEWLTGPEMTWTDLYVAVGIEQLEKVLDFNPVENYPNLGKMYCAVYAHEKVAEWVKKRPETQF